jgi:hypothetical protein
VYLSNKQTAESGASWSDYLAAFRSEDADALEEVAKLHGGTTAALWARQSAGDIKLAMGSRQLFVDRDEAEDALKDAEEHFLAVENDATGHAELVQRARYGLAQVYESLSKLDKAREYYDEVARSAPESSLGKSAKRRSDRLADKSVQRWYNWFERQEPSPPAMPPGGVGAGPKVSSDLDTLPERPDISFPGSEISKELQEIDPDVPLREESALPADTEPKETPAAGDDEEPAMPKSEGSSKLDEPGAPDEDDTGPESKEASS